MSQQNSEIYLNFEANFDEFQGILGKNQQFGTQNLVIVHNSVTSYLPTINIYNLLNQSVNVPQY